MKDDIESIHNFCKGAVVKMGIEKQFERKLKLFNEEIDSIIE